MLGDGAGARVGASRGGHGSGGGGSRIRDETRKSCGRRRERHASVRVEQHALQRCSTCGGYSTSKSCSGVRGPDPGSEKRRKAHGGVTFPASSSRPHRPGPVRSHFGPLCGPFCERDRREAVLRHETVPSLPRTPHVLGVSWRSQPARTSMRRPGHTASRPAPNYKLTNRASRAAPKSRSRGATSVGARR
jgi:hypothetical protein